MHLHDGLYQHKCVCVYWGRALTLLLVTHRPAKHSALHLLQCPRAAQLPLLIKQPVMGWVIWPAPEGSSDPGNAALRQTNRTKIQAKNSRKGWSRMWPRVRGIWATALGNQRGPGHGPKHWHSITHCSTVSAVLGTDLFQATSSLSHNAWTLSAKTRDHSQHTVWMGHLVRVGEEKNLCSKAVTLQLALWPVGSSLAYFIC